MLHVHSAASGSWALAACVLPSVHVESDASNQARVRGNDERAHGRSHSHIAHTADSRDEPGLWVVWDHQKNAVVVPLEGLHPSNGTAVSG